MMNPLFEVLRQQLVSLVGREGEGGVCWKIKGWFGCVLVGLGGFGWVLVGLGGFWWVWVGFGGFGWVWVGLGEVGWVWVEM